MANPQINLSYIGPLLRSARKAKELEISEVAVRVPLSEKEIEEIENGTRLATTAYELALLCQVYEIDVSSLFRPFEYLYKSEVIRAYKAGEITEENLAIMLGLSLGEIRSLSQENENE